MRVSYQDGALMFEKHDNDVFFPSGSRHTIFDCDWSSDVCSSDLRVLGHELSLSLEANVRPSVAFAACRARAFLPRTNERPSSRPPATIFFAWARQTACRRRDSRDRKSVV